MTAPLGYVVALTHPDEDGPWLAYSGTVYETPEAAAAAGRWFRGIHAAVVALIPVEPT